MTTPGGVGLSVAALSGSGTDHPHDANDLYRCLQVSPHPPTHMRDRSPRWTKLVDNWDWLSKLLYQELSERDDGRAPRTDAWLRQLRRTAGGV